MPPDDEASRDTRKQALFREVNDAIRRAASTILGGEGAWNFLCECGNAECHAPVRLSLEAYEAVRAEADWFLVVDGHADPGRERVLERHNGYVVVEAIGAAVETPGSQPVRARPQAA